MANTKHLEILKEGSSAWNSWRGENISVAPDLSEADLSEADLSGADVSGANLSGANLFRADLTEADLSGANLFRADLTEANLSGAALLHANLSGAIIRDVDLTGASVGWTVFVNLDVSAVRGLETLDHSGPSSVGVDTIYKSQGQIPEAFLRGAGLPDDFIAYVTSLVTRSIQFFSLRYSS